jgi:hypothetical protein
MVLPTMRFFYFYRQDERIYEMYKIQVVDYQRLSCFQLSKINLNHLINLRDQFPLP